MQEIIKSSHIADDLEKVIKSIHHDKLFVLTDEHTAQLCFPVIEPLESVKNAAQVVIPADDTNKTIENLQRVWQFLTENGASRHSLLINLGGGMVTDLGGFAAATFKRGIKYINIPTTILGAVDAAVGGKTGINFMGLKNEIGAFYPTEYVIIASTFFTTLQPKDILSGYAEMIKHALIHSQLDWEKLLDFPLTDIHWEEMLELVFRSVSIKERIVEKDPFEQNIRKALNLGHTVGHAFESFALEKMQPVPHGYAVAWGLIAELYLSHRLCEFPKEKLHKTARFIHQHYGAFNITCDDYEELYRMMTHDKKNEGGAINFTLLSEIGNVKIDQHADKKLIFESLDFFRDAVGI